MRTYRIQIRLIQTAVIMAVLVLVSGYFGAWGNEERQNVPATAAPTEGAGKVIIEGTNKLDPKIVAIGDSFTYGYPKDEDTSWPKYLGEFLNVPVVNKGEVYQTAKDLLSRFNEDVINEQPGRVIIFIGTGDVLQDVSLEDFQTNVKALVEKSNANHILPILALPLPYPSVEDEINEFREWETTYAQEKGILVLDFASELMDIDKKYKEGLSDDGKYPTPEGYRVMGQYAARVLQ